MHLAIVRLVVVGLLLGLVPAVHAETLDLRGKPFAERVIGRLSTLALGNEGECEFQQLDFDSETQQIYGKIRFQVSHNWDTVKWKDYRSRPALNHEQKVGVRAEALVDILYNLRSGTVEKGIDLLVGERSVTVLGKDYRWNFGKIEVSAAQLARVLASEKSALAESIPDIGEISRKGSTNYREVRAQIEQRFGGSKDVYFASKNPFVDAVRPSNGFGHVTSQVVTVGVSSTQIMRSVTKLAIGESDKVAEWLTEHRIAEASDIADSILKGEAVQIPGYYLAVNWVPIEYQSWIYVDNGTQQVSPAILESHGAFYIVLKRKNRRDATKLDLDGFDRGPIPENQDATEVESGAIDWGKQLANRAGDPFGRLARSPDASYEIHVHNKTKLSVNVILSRGYPIHYTVHSTLAPDQKHQAEALGASERIIGVWESHTGRLLGFKSIYMDRDLNVTIYPSPLSDDVSISLTGDD